MRNKQGQADTSTDNGASNFDSVDEQKRDFAARVLALFGGLGIVGGLSACEPEGKPNSSTSDLERASQAAFGTDSVHFADTVDELRNIAGSAQRPVAIVFGYWSKGDGGGGVFYWSGEPQSTPDDAGMAFNAGAAPGPGWRRVRIGRTSVRWFGARGDGALPTSGRDDYDAIVATINWVLSQPNTLSDGGEIWIPKGNYALRGPIKLTGATNIRLVGDGSTSTTLKAAFPNNQSAVVELRNCKDCSVENLQIHPGEIDLRVHNGILIQHTGGGAWHTVLRSLHIGSSGPSRRFVNGIQINNAPGADANNSENFFEEVDISHFSEVGIYFAYCKNSLNNKIIGGRIQYGPIGVRCVGGSFNMFGTHFAVSQLLFGLHYDASAWEQMYPVSVVGATLEAPDTSTKILETSPYECSAYLTNCTFKTAAPADGKLIEFQPPRGHLSLVGCMVAVAGEGAKALHVTGQNSRASIVNCDLDLTGITMAGNARLYSSGSLWRSLVAAQTTSAQGRWTSLGDKGHQTVDTTPARFATGELPTSPAGLSQGQLYIDSGYVKIA